MAASSSLIWRERSASASARTAASARRALSRTSASSTSVGLLGAGLVELTQHPGLGLALDLRLGLGVFAEGQRVGRVLLDGAQLVAEIVEVAETGVDVGQLGLDGAEVVEGQQRATGGVPAHVGLDHEALHGGDRGVAFGLDLGEPGVGGGDFGLGVGQRLGGDRQGVLLAGDVGLQYVEGVGELGNVGLAGVDLGGGRSCLGPDPAALVLELVEILRTQRSREQQHGQQSEAEQPKRAEPAHGGSP